ncbi:unnamed protein product, partial [Porites lobata]
MPACAETNRAMQELTGVKSNSGEQNKDMSKARQNGDAKDTLVILTTFEDRDPFSADPNLRNIMTGVNANNAVNVDRVRAIGEKILSSMTGKSATDYTFKRSSQAVTLTTKSSVRIESDAVQVDPQLLFQRLIVACNRSDDLQGLFRYELCSYPAALFDSSLTLRQPQKPVLADAIWAKLSSNATSGPEGDVQHVLDGGALLHRIPWPRGSATYQDIRGLYCSHVTKKYGNAINMTHQRRAAGKAGATVTFTENMKVTLKKDNFLANPKNKQRFINMLSRFLQEDNCPTYHAEGDADVLIVKTAVESAKERNTVLVGDDTDLLVLLCFYTRSDSFDFYFKPEPKENPRRRAAALKKYANSLHFREQAKVFNSPSTVDDIVVAGKNALVSLYGGKPGEKLDGMRYQRYCEKLATNSSQIQPQNLPLTSAAAWHHSLRVYLQVKQWKGENEGMSLEDYGWKVTEGQVLPRMTDLPAAP